MSPGMMCFGKKPSGPESKRNDEIEKALRADKKRQEREVKILLLGAGESGKSTVLKQMRLIHAGGFSKSERKQWRAVIFNNLVNAFQILLAAMYEQGGDFEDDENIKYEQLLDRDPEIEVEQFFPPEFLNAFHSLWHDKGIQLAMLKGNEYALHDNLTYFVEDMDRFFARNYLPTDQDILRTRLRTTGITETIFDLGTLTYRMFDVGGQRSERKKWIHVFDNVNVVMFLAAISGYDQALVEDRTGNQMNEALMLFEQISNSTYFTRSALLLFLNKIDLFKEKLSSGMSPVAKYFPDFHGKPTDVAVAQEYFAEKFKGLIRQPNKEVYVHFTNATDTDLLKKTMASVQDMIVQRNLNQLILRVGNDPGNGLF